MRVAPFALVFAQRLGITVCVVAALSACAGRDPVPVPLVQPYDAAANCSMWYAEAHGNYNRLVSLGVEATNTQSSNVALGVAGALLFWPALFAIDMKQAANKEIAELSARQQYLTTMMTQHRCTG